MAMVPVVEEKEIPSGKQIIEKITCSIYFVDCDYLVKPMCYARSLFQARKYLSFCYLLTFNFN